MQVYIARGGQRLGPFSIEEVNRKLASGEISATDQGWYEGAAAWGPLSNVPGVDLPGATTIAAAAGSTAPLAGTGRTEPTAIWSLVLGILGILCCGVLAAVPGIILGHMALNKIKANPGIGGKGVATAGLVISYLALVIGIISLIWIFGYGGMEVLQEMQNR